MPTSMTENSLPIYKQYPWSTGYWECVDWQNWYNNVLLSKYTKEEADYIWSKAWLSGVSCVSGGTCDAVGADWVFDSVPLECRTLNSSFKEFLNNNPNLKSSVFSGIGGLIAKPLSLGVSVVDAAGNVISNAADLASSTSKVLSKLIPWIIVIAAIMAIIWAYNKFVKK